jgi:maleylacetate reductase
MQTSALSFVFSSQVPKVVFGAGSRRQVHQELSALHAKHALIICGPRQRDTAEEIAHLIGAACVGIFDRAVMHVPAETADEAREVAKQLKADCVIAVGGGSPIGLAKAIALELLIPIIAIPTTYAGSEMTPIYGITKGGIKQTGRNAHVLPKTVIYDPTLSVDMPVNLSVTSGINAIAHAAEGMYASDANPVMSLVAEEGIRALVRGLPKVHSNPADIDGRSMCLYGAWLCGMVLGNVGMGLHHKLCHTLGGTCNLPHAETHTVVLPHVLAYNHNGAPEALQRLAQILGASNAGDGMFAFAKSLGAPTALKDIGMQAADLDRCAAIACMNAYANPREVKEHEIRSLLEDAYWGNRPGSHAGA